MGFGILQSKSGLARVPGTVQLEERQSNNSIHQYEHLKKGVHRGESVILTPQPSNDPNDPLNRPLWVRDMLFLVFAYCTVLVVGGIGPIISSLVPDLMILFNVSFTDVSLLTGYSLCATGAIGLFISAVSSKYGKRIPLLFSIACAFIGTVWGGASGSYDSLLGARIIQGFSVSMFESVFFAVVGDLYFVHERGVRTAAVTTCIVGISNLPAILAGKIATDLGWRWVFWLLAIFLGVALILVVLFGWETSFNRHAIYNTDEASDNNLDVLDAKNALHSTHVEGEDLTKSASQAETAISIEVPRQTFLARLKPYSTTYSDKPLWKLVLAPILILYNPVVIWAVLLASFPTLWLVALNLLTAQIFSAPPYNLNTAQLGYLSSGPAVGGVLGSLLAGILSDPTIEFLSRHNNGVYEPEFRLILIIPSIIFAAAGYFPFGVLIEAGRSPVIIEILWALATVAQQFALTVVGTYCIDAYRANSVEIFIITMLVKNFLFYGFSYFINDWITAWGPERMFDCVVGIHIGLCLLTIPLYVYGKRLRAWWHRQQHQSTQ